MAPAHRVFFNLMGAESKQCHISHSYICHTAMMENDCAVEVYSFSIMAVVVGEAGGPEGKTFTLRPKG